MLLQFFFYRGVRMSVPPETQQTTFNTSQAWPSDWSFCNWLWIEEQLQGRGLGRFLLRRARLELHRVGYRHAGISTAWDNHRALLFYSNDGYRFVDWTYLWSKAV